MSKIQDVFNQFYPSYEKEFGDRMPSYHKKVASDIMLCQTGHFGTTRISCQNCEQDYVIKNGCGNRNCGGCQKSKGDEWAEKQTKKLLPGVPYFMVTFTIPQEAHACFRANQKNCYDNLFKLSSETITVMLKNSKRLGTNNLGFFGVMHTGGRQLNYHPHIHFIVPNGGISKDGTEWLSGRQDYLFNIKAASQFFRNKIMAFLEPYLINYPELNSFRNKGWNVDVRQMGNGESSLKYLSRYLFKSVIAESNIVSMNKTTVTFKYREKDTNKKKTITVLGGEFIRRFLQLVMPKGFRKVRHYGYLSARPKKSIKEIKDLVLDHLRKLIEISNQSKTEECCPRCVKCRSHKISMVYSPLQKQELIIQKE